jgi:tRNA (adenine57-N1/adenine58-N1)-methyltransferase
MNQVDRSMNQVDRSMNQVDRPMRLLQPGDLVQLTDPKGKPHTITLTPGKTYFTHRGSLSHDDLIGSPEGVVVETTNGVKHVALRPLLEDFVLGMPRGATPVYPKDASAIVGFADVFPGATVVEAGAGSGALSCSLLRAVGEHGRLVSVERRPEFAEIAEANVTRFFGVAPAWWELRVGDLVDVLPTLGPATVDRLVLDMLAPWECIDVAGAALVPGGVLCVYVATTTQLSTVVEVIRAAGGFTEPRSWESMVRTWHVEGLAVRPDHRMIGHTGFLVTTRRLAPGVQAPLRRRRPAPANDAAAARAAGGILPYGADPAPDDAVPDGTGPVTDAGDPPSE